MALLVLLLLSVSVYAPAFDLGFLGDDFGWVKGIDVIRTQTGFPPGFLFTPVPEDLPESAPRFYRPLFFVGLLLDQIVFGFRAWGYHLVLLLLHGLSAWSCLCILRKLTGRRAIGWLGALLFLVFPLGYEAVLWVSCQMDAQCTCLFLLTINLLITGEGTEARPPGTLRGYLALVPCALALASKEAAIGLPAAMVYLVGVLEARRLGLGRAWIMRMVRYSTPVVLLMTLYLMLRLYVLRVLVGGYHDHAEVPEPLQLLAISGQNLLNYLRPGKATILPGFMALGLTVLSSTVLVWGSVRAWRSHRAGRLTLVICVGLLACALLPVFRFEVVPDVQNDGRLLYLGGAAYSGMLATSLWLVSQTVGDWLAKTPARSGARDAARYRAWTAAVIGGAALIGSFVLLSHNRQAMLESGRVVATIRQQVRAIVAGHGADATIIIYDLPERWGNSYACLNAAHKMFEPPFEPSRVPTLRAYADGADQWRTLLGDHVKLLAREKRSYYRFDRSRRRVQAAPQPIVLDQRGVLHRNADGGVVLNGLPIWYPSRAIDDFLGRTVALRGLVLERDRGPEVVLFSAE